MKFLQSLIVNFSNFGKISISDGTFLKPSYINPRGDLNLAAQVQDRMSYHTSL